MRGDLSGWSFIHKGRFLAGAETRDDVLIH
jgi:uncharacterized UPF0160 family protein